VSGPLETGNRSSGTDSEEVVQPGPRLVDPSPNTLGHHSPSRLEAAALNQIKAGNSPEIRRIPFSKPAGRNPNAADRSRINLAKGSLIATVRIAAKIIRTPTPTPMNRKPIRILFVTCLTLAAMCLIVPAQADQPRMDKAIELLEQAKTAKNPVELLEKAKTAVENATTGKGGRRFSAVRKIDKAIAAKTKGKDANPLIDEAIADLKEGKEIQEEKKGK
jgi:hypothetical protein